MMVLPPRFLKLRSSLITTPLTYIVNRSLTESKILTFWKKANVTPIHKGGTTDLSNYRPTSVLPAAILLGKLPFYGICGSSLAWLTNYLQDRQQRVYLHNVYSEWGRITHGVPQGSVLGPLLFCIHINDLPSCNRNCKIHMFTDDKICSAQLFSVTTMQLLLLST